ncbi:MAG TPA: hypothetical protein VFI42_02540, partial [Thermomicrobiaceae bacterium]|nr:hypothetical protein [Thermomicrobiaceae bacterium]
HAAHGRIPLYFYGQRYLGSLDAILAAPLVALLGERVAALRAVPFLWYAAFLALHARLAARICGRRVAWLSLLVLALPGWRVLMYTARSNVSFGAMATLGTALLLLTLEPRPRHTAARLALIGALAGLGLWVHPLSATYAGAALVVWWLVSPEWRAAGARAHKLLRTGAPSLLLGVALVSGFFSDGCAGHSWLLDPRPAARLLLLLAAAGAAASCLVLSTRRRTLLSSGIWLAAGLVLGSAPLWAGWLLAGERPTSAKEPACPAQALDRAHLLANQIIPAMWGAPFLSSLRAPFSAWDVGWLLLIALELLAVLVFLWQRRAMLSRLLRLEPLAERERGAALLTLLLLGPIALTLLSGNIYDAWHVRYLLVAWQADSIVLALLLERLLHAWRPLGLAALALFMAVNATAIILLAPGKWAARPEAISPSAAGQVEQYLQRQGVQGGYAGYWTAYALDYLSGERLTFTSLGQDRYSPYTRHVEGLTTIAVLLQPGMVPANQTSIDALLAGARTDLAQYHAAHIREEFGRMRILSRRTVGDWDVWLLTEQNGGLEQSSPAARARGAPA